MARKFLLNPGVQIEGEMKSIGNLLRLGWAAASAIGVQTLSIPADEFDPRVLDEPSRQRLRRAFWKKVDHSVAPQLH